MADDQVQPELPRDVGDPERREAGPAPDFELVRPYVSAMVDQEPSRHRADPGPMPIRPPDPATVQFDRFVTPDEDSERGAGRWRARAVPLTFAAVTVLVVVALIVTYLSLTGSAQVAVPAGLAPAVIPSIPIASAVPSSAAPVVDPTTPHRTGSTTPTKHSSPSHSASPSASSSNTPAGVPTSAAPPPPPQPVTGTIVGFGGLCVDDNGAVNPNGNHIQMYSCNTSAAQIWTWQSDGTLQVVGKCMQVTGLASNSLVELWDCDGSASEVWRSTRHGGIVNVASGLCLDDPNFSRDNFTQLDIEGCSRQPNQFWTMRPSQ